MSHDFIKGCVRPSVHNAFVSAGRDEPANDLFRVYELVSQFFYIKTGFTAPCLLKMPHLVPIHPTYTCFLCFFSSKMFFDPKNPILAVFHLFFR